MQAYLKLQRDYEDKLAALSVQQAEQLVGHNPLENRTLERNELKKACISLLTAQHYDWVGAIEEQPNAPHYPQVDLSVADAQGRYIRFFEQAFEWDQMVYFFYPYFWGRKAGWYDKVLLEDTDPQFAEFLKAGAARVVFPVRPGFEQAVANFLDGGVIWNGDDVPVTSPLYLPITEEIKQSQGAPGTEVPQGDPWDVKLPTTLVLLKEDSTLPAWEKNDSGDWVPA
jgi:hypothetical protein